MRNDISIYTYLWIIHLAQAHISELAIGPVPSQTGHRPQSSDSKNDTSPTPLPLQIQGTDLVPKGAHLQGSPGQPGEETRAASRNPRYTRVGQEGKLQGLETELGHSGDLEV